MNGVPVPPRAPGAAGDRSGAADPGGTCDPVDADGPVGAADPARVGGPDGTGAAGPVRVRLVGSSPEPVTAVRAQLDAAGLVVMAGNGGIPPTGGPPVDLTVVVWPVAAPLPVVVTRLRTAVGTGRIAVVSPPQVITPGALLAVLAAGADGWLTTDLPVDALRRTLIGVAHGEPGLARQHVTHLITALRHPGPRTVTRRDGTEVVLTDRQHEILLLLAMTPVPGTRAIAQRLCVDEGTVRWHLARLGRELQETDRAGLAAAAVAFVTGTGDRRPSVPESEPGRPGLPEPRSHREALPAADPVGPPPADAFGTGWAALSTGERTAVRLVASGMTNREIAARVELSHHTVDTQVKRAFAKLGVRSRVELTRALLTRRP